MSKEAMKLALEALESCGWNDGYAGENQYFHDDLVDKAITALREALNASLAKPDFWEGYVPEPVKPAEQCKWPTCQSEEYQQALAEQIKRELVGEQPAQQEQWDAIPDAFNEWWNADYDDTGNPYRKDSPAYWAWSGWKAASKQPEQEPVAWMKRTSIPGDDWDAYDFSANQYGEFQTPLYTSPPAQRTWVGLTGKEVMDVTRKEGHELLDFIYEYGTASEGTEERVVAICKAIEAKLRSKNEDRN